ncbi:MAG: transporter substrate-binding domain-containing protein [Oscillospiraceae bacterium]
MKKFLKISSLVLSVVLVMTMFASCGAPKAKEKLIMATNANFPPYEFIEGEGGKVIGIDAEIAGKIAEKLNMELQIEDVEFGSIVTGVQSGKFNMGMAGMTVTDERKQSVSFSNSYAKGIQVIIVKEGSTIKTTDDLVGKKIGVQQDTTGDIYASDTPDKGGFGKENVVSFKNGADAVTALTAGKVDAVIIDNEPAKAFVKANTGLKILDTEYVSEEYAICIAKENTALLEKVNKALDELIKDGTVKSIIDKYIKA